jgi:hypothetical protein
MTVAESTSTELTLSGNDFGASADDNTQQEQKSGFLGSMGVWI